MIINKALLKYGYSEFKLEILEYCTPKDLAKREQYYMDLFFFCPEYNVLKIAYSHFPLRAWGPEGGGAEGGYKHSEETLVKVRSNLEKLNLSKSIKVKGY